MDASFALGMPGEKPHKPGGSGGSKAGGGGEDEGSKKDGSCYLSQAVVSGQQSAYTPTAAPGGTYYGGVSGTTKDSGFLGQGPAKGSGFLTQGVYQNIGATKGGGNSTATKDSGFLGQRAVTGSGYLSQAHLQPGAGKVGDAQGGPGRFVGPSKATGVVGSTSLGKKFGKDWGHDLDAPPAPAKPGVATPTVNLVVKTKDEDDVPKTAYLIPPDDSEKKKKANQIGRGGAKLVRVNPLVKTKDEDDPSKISYLEPSPDLERNKRAVKKGAASTPTNTNTTGNTTTHSSCNTTGNTTGHTCNRTGNTTGHTCNTTGNTTGHTCNTTGRTTKTTCNTTGNTTGDTTCNCTGNTTGRTTKTTGNTTGDTTCNCTGNTTGHTTGRTTCNTTGSTIDTTCNTTGRTTKTTCNTCNTTGNTNGHVCNTSCNNNTTNADTEEQSKMAQNVIAAGPKKRRTRSQPEMNDIGEVKNLIVEPEKILFSYPYEKPQLCDVQLINKGKDIIQYKILATIPQYYRVRGKNGVLKPNQSTTATVRLEALADPLSVAKEQHRIMVQTAKCTDAERNKPNFWKEVDNVKNRMQFIRLKVKLLLEGESTIKDVTTLLDEDYVPPNEEGIIVEPEKELVFKGPFNEIVTSTICIINNTDKYMYIKVLVTNPEPFRVRPNFACINPRAMQVLAAMVEPIKDLDGMLKKKNKFMIEYGEAETNEVEPAAFWKSCNKFQSVKLQATFSE